MFHGITKEIDTIAAKLGTEQLRSLLPIYLFPSGEKDMDFDPAESLDGLLEDLEERDLFSAQSDGSLVLSLEYGSREWDHMGRLGLADEAGQFKTTLGQWMEYIMTRYRVSQGIVLIRLDCPEARREETVWWRRFFRQLHRYRRQFLFLFQAEKADVDSAGEWLGRECYCRRMELTGWRKEEYLRYFEAGLEKYDLCLDESGRKMLTGLLDRYGDRITRHGMERWQQDVLWEYFLKEKPGDGLPAGEGGLTPFLDEERFRRYISDDRDNKGIGFEVAWDAEKK